MLSRVVLCCILIRYVLWLCCVVLCGVSCNMVLRCAALCFLVLRCLVLCRVVNCVVLR